MKNFELLFRIITRLNEIYLHAFKSQGSSYLHDLEQYNVTMYEQMDLSFMCYLEVLFIITLLVSQAIRD